MRPEPVGEDARTLPVSWGFLLARLAGFEPATGCLEGSCSVQLSYRRPEFIVHDRGHALDTVVANPAVAAGRQGPGCGRDRVVPIVVTRDSTRWGGRDRAERRVRAEGRITSRARPPPEASWAQRLAGGRRAGGRRGRGRCARRPAPRPSGRDLRPGRAGAAGPGLCRQQA